MKKVLLFSCLLLNASVFSQLKINEVMASNTSAIADNVGNFSDWFEIYNAGPSNVDLAGYFATDLKSSLTKFRFTTTSGQVVVPANGYLLIWASGNTSGGGLTHTNFSLSQNGEAVYLVKPDGIEIVDSLIFPAQRENVSIGKLPDGDNPLKYFFPSSPNVSNSSTTSYDGFVNTPTFSREGGFFNSNFPLSLSHTDPAVTIYYTSDGSNPSQNNLGGTSYNYKNSYPEHPGDPFPGFLQRSFSSSLYSLPIAVQDRTGLANQVSMISSTFSLTPSYFPQYNIKKGTVIRAIATKHGFLSSDIKTNTYIYSASGQNPYTLPVISVAIQENHFYEYNLGIYNAGVAFENFRIANPTAVVDPCTPGNFSNNGGAWERNGNFEYIVNQYNVVNQPLGIRIHGSCSASQPYKSLRFYGRNHFNNYPFFPNYPSLLHDRIIARNGGNDYNQIMFKDVFVQAWLGHLNFASQKSRPSIMFINGEYWGIHDIRERIDKYYIEALFGADPNNIDLRKVDWSEPDEMEEGDSLHYTSMYNFIINNDMTLTSNYSQAIEYLDPKSLIDYEIAEIFVGNMDWPHNNVRLWRSKNAYNPNATYGLDGRWRWILYDTDRALGELVNAENLDLIELTNRPDNAIFKELLTNQEFKNNFINRYADLLNSCLKTGHALPIFNSYKAIYGPEFQNHIDRWKNFADESVWQAQCNVVSTYISTRPNAMINQLKDYFLLAGDYSLTVSSADTLSGYVRINDLPIISTTKGIPANYQTWTGLYFDNVPLTITAVPKNGFKFSYWIYDGLQYLQPTLTVVTTSNRTYTAYFEPIIISDNPVPSTSAELVKCGYSVTEWSSASMVNTSPPNSKFVYLSALDPLSNSIIEGFTSGTFNLTNATRINGKGLDGFSFINTGNGNTGYPTTKLGGFLLAINTMNLDTIKINWIGRTITANTKKYRIQLYYREGDVQNFQEFSPTIEYIGNTSSGHSQTFSNIILPNSMMNKPYVQLFWKYYFTGLGTSSRDELAIDDIHIKGTKKYSGVLSVNMNPTHNPNYILSTSSINSGILISNSAMDAIELKPGFEAKYGSVFKAEIKTCN